MITEGSVLHAGVFSTKVPSNHAHDLRVWPLPSLVRTIPWGGTPGPASLATGTYIRTHIYTIYIIEMVPSQPFS